MIYRLVHELAADGIDVAVACRVLRVSRSGFYEWRGRAPSARAVADERLTATITEVHAASAAATALRGCTPSFGSGSGWPAGTERVARLMRTAGLAGVCHRRKHRRAALCGGHGGRKEGTQ